ncbi:unnamed protein product, partial [Mesorhabditis belari]|uniref:Uncharacterized protein n=1 Tax=Mesorhabditis belari TaxID=2138241 RepID=A0AAF3JBI6_9BILA
MGFVEERIDGIPEANAAIESSATSENHIYLIAAVEFESIQESTPKRTRQKRWWWVVPAARCAGGATINMWANGASWRNGAAGCLGALVGKRSIDEGDQFNSNSNSTRCQMIALAFAGSDRNLDGRLSFEEVRKEQGINQTDAINVFRLRDANDNNFWDPEEVDECLLELSIPKVIKEKRCKNEKNEKNGKSDRRRRRRQNTCTMFADYKL